MLQEYLRSGYFTFASKLRQAAVRNLIYYGILFAAAVALLIYLLVRDAANTPHGLISYGLTAANAYGIFLLIGFMGYGLVDIPRSLWRHSDPEKSLRDLEKKAPLTRDAIAESEMKLQHLAVELQTFSSYKGEDAAAMQARLDSMAEKFPLISGSQKTRGIALQQPSRSSSKPLNWHTLAAVNRNFKNQLMHNERCKWYATLICSEWVILEKRAFHLQDILRNNNSATR
jgi:hypothetical protein